jgi:hypothetical protein
MLTGRLGTMASTLPMAAVRVALHPHVPRMADIVL